MVIVDFTLFGQRFQAMTAGPHHDLNDAISLVVCEDQAELDGYWDALLEGGGKAQVRGWLIVATVCDGRSCPPPWRR